MKKFKWDGFLIKLIELLLDIIVLVIGFQLAIIYEDYLAGGSRCNFVQIVVQDIFPSDSIVDLTRNVVFYINLVVGNFLYVIIVAIFFRIYRTSIVEKRYSDSIVGIGISLVFTSLILIIINFLVPNASTIYDTKTFLYTFIFQFSLFIMYKYVLWRLLRNRNIKNVIIIGPTEEAVMISKKFLVDNKHYKNLKYIYFAERDNRKCEHLYDKVDECDEVYVTPDTHRSVKNDILTYCLSKKDKDICLIPKMYEIGMVNAKMEQIDDVLAFRINSLHLSLEQKVLKRGFDILVSTLLIIFTSPIMLATAIVIKIEDKGPVFFKQKRVTQDNVIFNIIKFRSMFVNAEERFGIQQSSKGDPRITKVGKFIRMVRIDELPQLFQVLTGKLSLVGPRALRVEEVSEFVKKNPTFVYRFNVRAGITGLAQASAKYDISFEDKLRYDLLYIREYSFLKDIRILFLTFKTLLSKSMAEGMDLSMPLEDVADNKGITLMTEGNITEIVTKK